MISDTIQRIEELRYGISKKTYEMMQNKTSGQSGNQVGAIESELISMKQEMGNNLSLIQDAGYVYIFRNKNEINRLKDEFSSLSPEEKRNSFRGIGKGHEIMQKSLSLLNDNFNKRKEIATLIISLPADESVATKIKNVIEGYSEGEGFKLESQLASSRISSLLKSLGIRADCIGEGVYIGNKAGQGSDKDEEFVAPVSHLDDFSVKEEPKQEAVQLPVEDVHHASGDSYSKHSGEVSKPQLKSEDLEPSLSYEEVCSKIKEILGNYKMKRWVLGAFKDDEERKQYDKVQTILVKLMRLKQSMEEKGEN